MEPLLGGGLCLPANEGNPGKLRAGIMVPAGHQETVRPIIFLACAYGSQLMPCLQGSLVLPRLAACTIMGDATFPDAAQFSHPVIKVLNTPPIADPWPELGSQCTDHYRPLGDRPDGRGKLIVIDPVLLGRPHRKSGCKASH
jgi:hypothetical protein